MSYIISILWVGSTKCFKTNVNILLQLLYSWNKWLHLTDLPISMFQSQVQPSSYSTGSKRYKNEKNQFTMSLWISLSLEIHVFISKITWWAKHFLPEVWRPPSCWVRKMWSHTLQMGGEGRLNAAWFLLHPCSNLGQPVPALLDARGHAMSVHWLSEI